MKKAITVLLCFAMLVSTASCVTKKENSNLNTPSLETVSDTTDTVTTCTHILGEWSVSNEATEREDGEEKRTCSLCEYFETKPIYAKGTEGLSFTLSEDGTSYSVSAGSATEGDVFIPAYHNGLPVTSIGHIGLANSDFEPEDVEIGSYAFFGCADLQTVVIPSTVTVIGDGAFARCESMENIIIPSTVTIIGDGAFMLCKSLESVVIPESVKEIGEYAFALTEVEFPIGYYHSDIAFSIPNSQVILLLRPVQSVFSWGVELYYLDESGNAVLIENILVDNSSHAPFSNKDFEIVNNDDMTFSVHAKKSENGEDWILNKTFDLPQCVSVFVPKAEDTVAVFYGGNDGEEWDAIDIADGNVRLTKDNITVKNCVIYYYSETEPTEANKFWHYVDGVPTVW